MSILLDSFSYRDKTSINGVYVDRWHNNSFPDFYLVEKIYFINNIINAILLHDKIYIRLDSLEEFIEVFGIVSTSKLISNDILKVLDGWFSPAFLIHNNPPGQTMFMDLELNQDQAHQNTINRLRSTYSRSERSHIEYVIHNELVIKEVPSIINNNVRNNLDIDISNQNLRSFLKIKSENNYQVVNEDEASIVRLYLLNRTIEWSHVIDTDELFLEGDAKLMMLFKSGVEFRSSLIEGINEILLAKSIPNLSFLYYTGAISIDDLLDVRNNACGFRFREWIKTNEYNVVELRKKLMEKIPSQKTIQLLRWSCSTMIGCMNLWLGLGLSIIDLLDGYKKDWTPSLYFDDVLSERFNKKIIK